MTREMIDDENWIIGSSPPTSQTIPSSQMSQNFVSHLSSSSDQLARKDTTGSPAMPEIGTGIRPSSAGSSSPSAQQPSPLFQPMQHPRTQQLQNEQTASPGRKRKLGSFVTRTTNQYTAEVLSSSQGLSGSTVDIKKTMKASKIQHDVVSNIVEIVYCKIV